jgi:hypothetical protein
VPPPHGSSPLPLAAVIAAAVALDEALLHQQYPQARHHARLVALRSHAQGLYEIAAAAEALMVVLGEAIQPTEDRWMPFLNAVHQAIDRAFDPSTPFSA